MATYSISSEGVDLIKRWESARKNVQELRRQLQSAECELSNSENALGKCMVPDVPDTEDEQFNVWVGNGLLSAKKVGGNDYHVKWRKLPTGDSGIY